MALLCDFHREQSWERWLSCLANGLASRKAEVLNLLRPIAKAPTAEEYNKKLSDLKDSEVWKSSPKLQKYFNSEWLSCAKVIKDLNEIFLLRQVLGLGPSTGPGPILYRSRAHL